MSDLEPVEPGAVVRRGAGRAVVPERWPATGRPRSRALVAARVRALTTELLPVAALAVTAVTAARAAVRAVGTTRRDGRPDGRVLSGRDPASPAPAATVQVSWTHVEIRLR